MASILIIFCFSYKSSRRPLEAICRQTSTSLNFFQKRSNCTRSAIVQNCYVLKKPSKELNVQLTFNPFPHMNMSFDCITHSLSLYFTVAEDDTMHVILHVMESLLLSWRVNSFLLYCSILFDFISVITAQKFIVTTNMFCET